MLIGGTKKTSNQYCTIIQANVCMHMSYHMYVHCTSCMHIYVTKIEGETTEVATLTYGVLVHHVPVFEYTNDSMMFRITFVKDNLPLTSFLAHISLLSFLFTGSSVFIVFGT